MKGLAGLQLKLVRLSTNSLRMGWILRFA
ncbi:hypothetical protein LINPERPRIM_LOCUS31474 [Linum perenne]